MKLPNTPLLDTGNGQPMILLNGLLGSVHTWIYCVQEFSKAYRILIPRLPLTSYPFTQARMNDLVAYLEDFIEDHVGPEPVVMIGAFRGGCIATLYALRNPARVDRLILSGSLGLFDHTFPEKLPAQKQAPMQGPLTKMVKRAGSRLLDETSAEWSEPTWSDVNKVFQREATRGFFCDDRVLRALLVWGRDDKRSPSEVAWQYYDLLGSPEIVFIEDCGHAPVTERPKMFNRIVREYLGRENSP